MLGLCAVLFDFLLLLLGCTLGSDSLDERLVLLLASALGLHSGLVGDCKLLLRPKVLIYTTKLLRAARPLADVIVCGGEMSI